MEINKLFKIISATTLAGIMFIGCGEKVTFKGQEYKIITSPITGKKWLDRNLGATEACTSSTDKACYGDYYQWGRLADGHEKASSNMTSALANDISDIGNRFVVGYKDWTSADNNGKIRTVQWSKIDGTGVCPIGFRVPTVVEFKAELTEFKGVDNTSTGAVKVTNLITAFQNFLKLPVPGARNNFDGSLIGQGLGGMYWTNSVDDSDIFSQAIGFSNKESKYLDIIGTNERSLASSVRCIKDN